jgi:hypothetical protein
MAEPSEFSLTLGHSLFKKLGVGEWSRGNVNRETKTTFFIFIG